MLIPSDEATRDGREATLAATAVDIILNCAKFDAPLKWKSSVSCFQNVDKTGNIFVFRHAGAYLDSSRKSDGFYGTQIWGCLGVLSPCASSAGHNIAHSYHVDHIQPDTDLGVLLRHACLVPFRSRASVDN